MINSSCSNRLRVFPPDHLGRASAAAREGREREIPDQTICAVILAGKFEKKILAITLMRNPHNV